MTSESKASRFLTISSWVILVVLCLTFIVVPTIMLWGFGRDTMVVSFRFSRVVPSLYEYRPFQSSYSFTEGLCLVLFTSLWIVSLSYLALRHKLFPKLSVAWFNVSWIVIVAFWPFWIMNFSYVGRRGGVYSPWVYLLTLEAASVVLCISIPFSIYFIFSRTGRRVFSRGVLNPKAMLPKRIRRIRLFMILGTPVLCALLVRMAWVWWLGFLLFQQPEVWRAAGIPDHYPFLPVTGDQMVHSFWKPLLVFEAAGILPLMFCFFVACVRFFQRLTSVSRLPMIYLAALLIFATSDFILSRIIYPRPPLELLATLAFCAIGIPFLLWARKGNPSRSEA